MMERKHDGNREGVDNEILVLFCMMERRHEGNREGVDNKLLVLLCRP
jgi:hypothetical protein